MISDEDLQDIASVDDWYMGVHLGDMARELLTLRKAFSEPAATFTHCTVTGNEKWIQTKGGEPLYRKPNLNRIEEAK